MDITRPYAKQKRFRRWLKDNGFKQRWASKQLGYSEEYFSRVINGLDPLTDKFKERCTEILGVHHDVWVETSE
jgi:plasmid maintenance system antidote protein VapI